MSLANSVKSTIKSLIPRSAVGKVRRMLLKSDINNYKNMENNEAIFDKVYSDLVWQRGTDSKSSSGDGSDGLWLDESIKYITEQGFLENRRALEIGCGDFSFGSQIAGLADHYTAGDVSGKIIGQNKERYGDMSGVTFMQIDAASDALPEVDVVIIRQVLQHLTNDLISAILDQLDTMKPEKIIVFEDVPADDFKPNHDLETAGPYTRHLFESGVDLSKPPFSRPFRQTVQWLHPRHPQVPARLVCYELN